MSVGPFYLRPQICQENQKTRNEQERRKSVLFICLDFHTRQLFWFMISHAKKSLSKMGGDIGEVFLSSVYNVPCMYVSMFVIRDGM